MADSCYNLVGQFVCKLSSYFSMSDDVLKRAGITQYEFTERLKATLILTSLMQNIKENKTRTNQTNYLIDNDIMSDLEWDAYLELRWPTFKDDKN